jgi:hypothetical protein
MHFKLGLGFRVLRLHGCSHQNLVFFGGFEVNYPTIF